MGNIVKLSFINDIELPKTSQILYCVRADELKKCPISVNRDIAQQLSKYSLQRRSIYLEQCLINVLNKLEDNPLIRDFDVLFNPVYEVDVLTLLISAYRKKPFSIFWCGTYSDGKLEYSKEGFRDYKNFNIDAYDITCII